MKLNASDHIITAFAESASGPGWGNSPIWIVVRAREGTLRLECLQPDDQSQDMKVLYGLSQAAHAAMTVAVSKLR